MDQDESTKELKTAEQYKLELEEKVQSLAKTRILSLEHQEEFKKYEKEFNDQHSALIENIKLLKQAIVSLENSVRYLGVKVFNLTGDKTPANGVTIKHWNDIEYDEDTVFEWALRYEPNVLSLDKDAFIALAKAKADKDGNFSGTDSEGYKSPIAKVVSKPKTSISKNLLFDSLKDGDNP